MARTRAPGGGTLIHEKLSGERKVIRYSFEQTRQHEALIEGMLARGLVISQILRVAKKEYGLKRSRVNTILQRIRERFQQEDSAARPAWKSEQIRRLMRQMQVAMGEKDKDGKWITKPNLSAYTKIESILADIQGTREPLEINVDVSYTEAMMTVIGTMSPEHMNEMLEAARERKRLAEAYEVITANQPTQ